jgi:hypothetical protein
MEQVPLDKGEFLIDAAQVSLSVPLAMLGDVKGISSITAVIPAGALYCEDQLFDGEVAIVSVLELDGVTNIVTSTCTGNGSIPADWRFDIAPADDDAEDDSGVAFDFAYEKVWGIDKMETNPAKLNWSQKQWRLRIDGSTATNDSDYYDLIRAEFAWSKMKSFVGEAVDRKFFTAHWYNFYFRPEATFDGDNRDYVFGASWEALTNLQRIVGSDIGTGTRPYLLLGIETVDPDKRDDGSVPGNYQRLTGKLKWKVYVMQQFIVEANWEGIYILDEDDADEMMLDQMQDRFDVVVSAQIGDNQFRPLVRYTRGEQAPEFNFVEEVFVGLVWDRLFSGKPGR